MTDLVKRLIELREKATPGPWWYQHDEYSDPNYNETPAERPLGVIRSGDNKQGVFVTFHDLEGSGSITPENAALICELVNSLDTIIAALQPSGEMVMVPREPTPEMVARMEDNLLVQYEESDWEEAKDVIEGLKVEWIWMRGFDAAAAPLPSSKREGDHA
jgi:hypothetical protein